VPIELGAEFIHGQPRVICDLADSAGLRLVKASERRLLSERGRLKPLDDFWEIIDEIDSQIPSRGDETYEGFLREAKGSELYKGIAKAYVEGFNAARGD
jgi:hypothetical protein